MEITTIQQRQVALTDEQAGTIQSWLAHVQRLLTQSKPAITLGTTTSHFSDEQAWIFKTPPTEKQKKVILAANRQCDKSIIIMRLTRLAATRKIFNPKPKEAEIEIETAANKIKHFSELAIIQGIDHTLDHPVDRYFPQPKELMAAIAPFDARYKRMLNAMDRKANEITNQPAPPGYNDQPVESKIMADYAVFNLLPNKTQRAKDILALFDELQEIPEYLQETHNAVVEHLKNASD